MLCTVNIKVNGRVSKRAVYAALAINNDGNKELLGLWIGEAEAEGAKFWLKVLTELKNRGLQDILIACCDGLKGFPQAIENVYPKTQVQLCIVHLIRNCMRYVSWKHAKAVATDLKPRFIKRLLCKKLKPLLMLLLANGILFTLPSAKSGFVIGTILFPFLITLWRSVVSFTLPMPLNLLTALCVRSLRLRLSFLMKCLFLS